MSCQFLKILYLTEWTCCKENNYWYLALPNHKSLNEKPKLNRKVFSLKFVLLSPRLPNSMAAFRIEFCVS